MIGLIKALSWKFVKAKLRAVWGLSKGSSGLVHVGTFTVSGSGSQLLLPDGSASVPALAFAAQTADGIYSALNGIGFAVNAQLRVAFPSAANGGGNIVVGCVNANDAFLEATTLTTGIGSDLRLFRDAANTLAQRNGTAAQTARWYSTYTDGSNYERLAVNLTAGGSSMQIAAETAGTGVDNIDLLLTPAGTGNVRFGTHSALAAETVTGYITIKDAAGNSRKVAVVS